MSDKLDKSEQKSIKRRHMLAAGAGLLATISATAAQAGFKDYCLKPQPCFLKGTRIETSTGLRAVEDLKEGDLVKTVEGTFKPVRWVGATTVHRNAATWSRNDAPVKIAAGALADNVPSADLYVSPDHALYVDGVLVPAKYLVNGSTVVSVTDFQAAELLYLHIELDRHEVIYAEGAPVETFLEWNNRDRFDNATTYSGRRTGAASATPYAPLLVLSTTQQLVVGIKSVLMPGGRHRGRIDAIHAGLAARAATLGKTSSAAQPHRAA